MHRKIVDFLVLFASLIITFAIFTLFVVLCPAILLTPVEFLYSFIKSKGLCYTIVFLFYGYILFFSSYTFVNRVILGRKFE